MIIEPYNRELTSSHRDFHAVETITLGELVDWGWIDWTDNTWRWDAYNDEQYNRLTKKIEARYWTREIGILPPGEWKRAFIRKMNEIAPKYNMLYKLIDDGINILQDNDTYHKERSVNSEYPQTRIGGNQDYASSGYDNEYETIIEGSPLDKIEKLQNTYQDVDVRILDEIEILFSSLLSMNINAY